MDFCQFCNNLLIPNIRDNALKFECKSCLSIYSSKPEDTLRYEEIKGGNILIYDKILSLAALDPVNPKVEIVCPKCSNNIAKQVRLGDDMRLINTCLKCNFQWS